jgi:hypothetical protein
MLALGVCPEIRIVEINAHLHAIHCRALTKLDRRGKVIISAAVSVSVLIIGIVPYAKADIVDACLRHRHKNVLFLAFEIIVFYAAVFLSKYDGGVHSADKVFRNPVNRLNENFRLLRR